MISLRQLFLGAYPDHPGAASLPDIPVRGVECDSRKVEKGYVFIAVRGKKLDGADFIEEAERRGASAVVAELQDKDLSSIPLVSVSDSREAVARLASVFYGHPTKHMKVVGITGTNGKTTTAYLLEHLLLKKQSAVGVIGTVNHRYADVEIPAFETTPGPLRLQEIFSKMLGAGCTHALMEVSSHALDQNRVGGIDFAVALFTNLTQDHLDYHGTMEHYFGCKAKLFLGLSEAAFAVLNRDDAWVAKLIPMLHSKVRTVGLSEKADLRAVDIEHRNNGTRFDLVFGKNRVKVGLPLIGAHNVYNALGAMAAFHALGFSMEEAAMFLEDFPGVPGRLEPVREGQDFTVLVDFAHTPDGLDNVLRSLASHRQGRLILVFGCGGDRDRAKRPQMAAIAARHADRVYVTSDNPRSEDPKAIADEIRAGFPEDFKDFTLVLDRRKAIRQALLGARCGDIVLLAGKGHEQSQIIGSESVPFSDREEAERVLRGR